MHIAVLMGGWSAERPVSLQSGNGCADALESLGHRVTRIDIAGSLVGVGIALAEGVCVTARVTASAWAELGAGLGDRLWVSVKATQVRAIRIAACE